jgi:hypothetical protein
VGKIQKEIPNANGQTPKGHLRFAQHFFEEFGVLGFGVWLLSADVTQRVGPDLASGRELLACLQCGRGLTQGQALRNYKIPPVA